ncbi:MAG: CheR family methyltransferase [Chloroflexota bacterium]
MSEEIAGAAPTPPVAEIDAVLEYLCQHSGLDFRAYRRPMIERRLCGRMRLAGETCLPGYLERLRCDEEEVGALIGYVTIKVSHFWRDRHVYELLRAQLLPELARARRPLAVWSAGCGRGEEPYSLAMLLVEAGIEGTVVATDIDNGALAAAQAGLYQATALKELTPAQVERYFTVVLGRRETGYLVGETLRRRVRWLHHDLAAATTAPEGGAYDLVLCRNVLIYFGSQAQARSQELLLHSLAAGGLLCLGEAEWPLSSVAAQLQVVDRQSRLFRRLASPGGKP